MLSTKLQRNFGCLLRYRFSTCPDNHRSRTGIAIGNTVNLVHLTSTLQKAVTLSSAQVELYAPSEAVRVIAWLRNLASEWRFPKQPPTPLGIDSTGAFAMFVASSPNDQVQTYPNSSTLYRETSTLAKSRLADMCTKPLHRVKFTKT